MSTNVKKGNKVKSCVWNHYIKEELLSARCKLCTKLIKHGGNTTNLMQHLIRKHTIFINSEDSIVTDQQHALRTTDESDPDDPKEGTSTMNNVLNTDKNMTTRSCPRKIKIRNVNIDEAFKKIKSYKGGEISTQLIV
ncbi:PREDICTED: uncharacterized protein LOC108777008 [Cyphomyrmex costatus]|uniref:uncharacterized protein LOC108777008 n=1 Tax=Cyphomyrmex costatus TaxID=456900 RepID=UPI0008521D1F|nr:PREDICTED: uncharacterized protein LOC108777008 [Cyphomyrmex costatus]